MKVECSKSAPALEPAPQLLAHPGLKGVRVVLLDNWRSSFMLYNDHFWITHRWQTNNELYFRGRRFFTPSRTIGIMDPDGFFRTGRSNGPVTVSIIMIDPLLVERAAAELGGREPPRFGGLQTIDDLPLFEELGCVLQAFRWPATEFELASRFASLLRSVLRRAGEFSSPTIRIREPVAIRRARDLIHEVSSENLTLQTLEEEARISRYSLVHAFTNHFGIPPHAYQNQLRLARARRALESGMLPVDAAIEAGFYDQSHFNRLFKRSLGMTPASYASAFFGPRRRCSNQCKNSVVKKRRDRST